MTLLRQAVLDWTRARLRWQEFVLADVGSEPFRRLLSERAERHQALMVAETQLLRVGNRLLLQEKGE